MKNRHTLISIVVTVVFLISGIVYAVKGDLTFSLISFAVAVLFALRFWKAGKK